MEVSVSQQCSNITALISMFIKGVRMYYRIFILLFFFGLVGCSASSADLNKIAQDALLTKEEMRGRSAYLDKKFLGADKNAILEFFGKPRNKSIEPYPYLVNPNCSEKNCEKEYSDEIWFYEFKKKAVGGWEFYSVYVYFKDGKVVRVR